MYQIVEYDRHLAEKEIVIYLLANAPIVPAYRLGEKVVGVQVAVDGIELAVDLNFTTEDLARTYMTDQLTQLQAQQGMQVEALPRNRWTAPAVVSAYRAFN